MTDDVNSPTRRLPDKSCAADTLPTPQLKLVALFLFSSFKLKFYYLYWLYQCLSLASSTMPCIEYVGKGKGFPYWLPSVEPGADPGLQAVSPQVTISCPPGGRLPLLSTRPAVTFPAAEHHRPLAGTMLYCLVTEAHRCEQLAQGCYASFAQNRIQPTTCWSQVQRTTRWATAPPIEYVTVWILNNSLKISCACVILHVSHSILTKQALLAQIIAQFTEKQ